MLWFRAGGLFRLVLVWVSHITVLQWYIYWYNHAHTATTNEFFLLFLTDGYHSIKLMWLALVLSPMTESLTILSHKHKAWWMHYQISLPQTTRVKGSAFSSCFSQALWRAVRAVWGPDRALANQEMVVCSCTAPWCWIMTDLSFKIPSIFEPWMTCNLA